jgi:transcriptional regulator with XRE-family HTH domain
LAEAQQTKYRGRPLVWFVVTGLKPGRFEAQILEEVSVQNTFALWLNDFMEQHQYTQQSLAEKLGVSHVAISKWQRSLNLPEPRQLQGLAKVSGLNPLELFQFCGYLPAQMPKQPKLTARPRVLAILKQLEEMDDDVLALVADQIRAAKRHAKLFANVGPVTSSKRRGRQS